MVTDTKPIVLSARALLWSSLFFLIIGTMSVKRLPAKLELMLKTSSLPHYGFDSALHSASTSFSQEDIYFNATKHQKRILQATTEQSKSISEEIKAIFTELKTQMLNRAVSTVISQNENIQKTVDIMSNRYDELLLLTNSLESENVELRKKISFLEGKIQSIEKASRKSSIEIRNIPKLHKESVQSLSNIVKDIGLAVGLEVPLQNSDIKQIYNAKSEAIVVEFTTTSNKASLISKLKKLIKFALTRSSWKEPPTCYIHLSRLPLKPGNFSSLPLNLLKIKKSLRHGLLGKL